MNKKIRKSCEHQLRKDECKKCNTNKCSHNKIRYRCVICNKRALCCKHNVRKYGCAQCKREKELEDEKKKMDGEYRCCHGMSVFDCVICSEEFVSKFEI